MNYHITVGSYKLNALESVKINKSVETLSDTAIIVIPFKDIADMKNFLSKVKKDNRVSIQIGYDANLETEFKGYLNEIKTDEKSITLDCIDALYIFKKTAVKDVELKNNSVKQILQHVVSETNAANAAKYKVDCKYDFTYEKFVFYKASAYDVLKKVQEEVKANIYFNKDTLVAEPPYTTIKNENPVIFDFSFNVEKSDLKYMDKDDKNIEIEVVYTSPAGKKQTITYGKSGGEKKQVVSPSGSTSDMQKLAKSNLDLYLYDGYEGSFIGWLVPYVESAYKVALRNEDFRDRDGNYYVIATETNFSESGGSRKITLGRKIG